MFKPTKEQILHDAKKLTQDLAELAAEKSESARDTLMEGVNNLTNNKYEESRRMARERARQINELAHQKPWLMIAITSVASALIALILGTMSNKRRM